MRWVAPPKGTFGLPQSSGYAPSRGLGGPICQGQLTHAWGQLT